MYPINHVLVINYHHPCNVVVNGAEFELAEIFAPTYIGSARRDFVAEEPLAVKLLASFWEVRTKVICDTLTSIVFASKPILEQSFDNTANVLIASDEGLRRICVTER